VRALVVGAGGVGSAMPNPALLGGRMRGRTRAGSLVTGTGVDGLPRPTYLYQVVDNEWTMSELGHQALVWQTAVHPVVALELLASGQWQGVGVLGPEALPAEPLLDRLPVHGPPWAIEERAPSTG
jgi:saccharopine dehydrogenase (NAD+, L-lysine-forming)